MPRSRPRRGAPRREPAPLLGVARGRHAPGGDRRRRRLGGRPAPAGARAPGPGPAPRPARPSWPPAAGDALGRRQSRRVDPARRARSQDPPGLPGRGRPALLRPPRRGCARPGPRAARRSARPRDRRRRLDDHHAARPSAARHAAHPPREGEPGPLGPAPRRAPRQAGDPRAVPQSRPAGTGDGRGHGGGRAVFRRRSAAREPRSGGAARRAGARPVARQPLRGSGTRPGAPRRGPRPHADARLRPRRRRDARARRAAAAPRRRLVLPRASLHDARAPVGGRRPDHAERYVAHDARPGVADGARGRSPAYGGGAARQGRRAGGGGRARQPVGRHPRLGGLAGLLRRYERPGGHGRLPPPARLGAETVPLRARFRPRRDPGHRASRPAANLSDDARSLPSAQLRPALPRAGARPRRPRQLLQRPGRGAGRAARRVRPPGHAARRRVRLARPQRGVLRVGARPRERRRDAARAGECVSRARRRGRVEAGSLEETGRDDGRRLDGGSCDGTGTARDVTAGRGARARHPQRSRGAPAELRRRNAVRSAVRRGGEDRHEPALHRQLGGRDDRRIHRRGVGRQLQRPSDAGRRRDHRRRTVAAPGGPARRPALPARRAAHPGAGRRGAGADLPALGAARGPGVPADDRVVRAGKRADAPL